MVGFYLKINKLIADCGELEVSSMMLKMPCIAQAFDGLISGNYEVIQLILYLGLNYQALGV